jgi:hypothetical protein
VWMVNAGRALQRNGVMAGKGLESGIRTWMRQIGRQRVGRLLSQCAWVQKNEPPRLERARGGGPCMIRSPRLCSQKHKYKAEVDFSRYSPCEIRPRYTISCGDNPGRHNGAEGFSDITGLRQSFTRTKVVQG